MLSDVRTASSEVQTSYYGQPVIKAPHWRWLVINYFFAAALTGSSFALATLGELFSRDRAMVRTARYLSLAAVIPAPILLVLDLGRPDRALHMFRIIKLRSPMSLGSWALLFHGLFTGATAALQAVDDLTGSDRQSGLRRALSVAGLPFALFVAGYTGVLLAVTNVPLWARNYMLMGPTFLASAFGSGLSSLSLLLAVMGGENRKTEEALARVEAVAMTAELGLLAAGIVRLGQLGRPLTAGRYGLIFWPVTVVSGLLTPLTLIVTGPLRGSHSRSRTVLTSLLALTGGYSLRMLMILAGHESADRPEDYFEFTRSPQ